jgi:hypothetical protein
MDIEILRNKKSPFLLDGWIEYNKLKWGVQPSKFHWHKEGSPLPSIDAVFYLNKRGKIVLPPLNPYVGLHFSSTSTSKNFNIYSQWIQVADELVQEMKECGIDKHVMLPPGVVDVRPWEWEHFRSSVKYTYIITFPYSISEAKGPVRTNIKKALKNGYTATKTTNMKEVYSCLLDTEERQQFSHQLSLEDLQLMQDLLGEEHLKAYVCYAPNGETASATTVIHREGGYSVGLVMGTKKEHAASGVNYLMDQLVIDDVVENGAMGIDLCGANIRSIAKAKRVWGGTLVPYYSIENGLFSLARTARKWWHFHKRD